MRSKIHTLGWLCKPQLVGWFQHSSRHVHSRVFAANLQAPVATSFRKSYAAEKALPHVRRFHRLPGASPRDMADLEDRVWSAVGDSVKDPEIGFFLNDLGWMTRRLAVSEDGTIQVLLKLPTMLHPSIDQLKEEVRDAAEMEIRKFLSEKSLNEREIKVNVEAVATTPMPFIGSREDPKEIESRLGPGLVNVAHYLAVYSCKVSDNSSFGLFN